MPILLATLLLASAAESPAPAVLRVDVTGLRNRDGLLRACLTANRLRFPDCRRDPAALKLSVPATASQLTFSGFVPGDYAVTLFHDVNGNGKLDTMLGIPREGFGFSRNPVVRFGAPKYDDVVMKLRPGFNAIVIRAQYIL